jgi:hypothetical protein
MEEKTKMMTLKKKQNQSRSICRSEKASRLPSALCPSSGLLNFGTAMYVIFLCSVMLTPRLKCARFSIHIAFHKIPNLSLLYKFPLFTAFNMSVKDFNSCFEPSL